MRGGLFSFQRLLVQLSLHQHGVTLLHCTGLMQVVASIRFSHRLTRDYFLLSAVFVKTSKARVDGTVSILVGSFKAANQNMTPLAGPFSTSPAICPNPLCLTWTHKGSVCLQCNWLCRMSWEHNCYTCHVTNLRTLLPKTLPLNSRSLRNDRSSCPNLTFLL